MTSQVIPEAAVEAAARGLSEHFGWVRRPPWDALTPAAKDALRNQARAALEAAAPHMLAEAWDEGANADHDFDGQVTTPNPYRPAK